MGAAQPREYGGPRDLLLMQRAVQRGWTPQRRWHIGDLAWGRYSVPAQEQWRTALWDDLAWGWLDTGNLDLHVDPSRPDLADEVLAWCDDVVTGVTILDTEEHLVRALRRAGFGLQDGLFFQHCLIDLDRPFPPARVPEGYRVRAVRDDEAELRAAVHRAAWRPRRVGELHVPPRDLGEAESRVTGESYRAVMRAWPYRSDLDIVVEAPDGTFAAFALGWLDEVNRVGELEPVGTTPEHARRGLGTVASLACLEALRRAGATRAVVYPRGDDAYPVPRSLYLGLGFRPIARTVTYHRARV
jgi:GNAT superfamily N-acetyltransferase